MIDHPSPISGASYSAAELTPENDVVLLLDQRRLPATEAYERYDTADGVTAGIRDMVVRGAPAIGVAAAYAVVLQARTDPGCGSGSHHALKRLLAARPTAVNLAWAVAKMRAAWDAAAQGASTDITSHLAETAREIHRADVAANRAMGAIGAKRLPAHSTVLTHCNAGALATGGYGTALGVIRAAVEQGKQVRVIADETRPYLQGARLTSWELSRDGIEVDVIVDGASGSLFSADRIDAVVVGSDRVARNGDVANKIGTYTVACLARAHGRPFYVAAPWSTVDLDCASGDAIPIESRSEAEVRQIGSSRLVPAEAGVQNPSFDVTPHRLVSALFTERGAAEPLSQASLASLAAAEPGAKGAP